MKLLCKTLGAACALALTASLAFAGGVPSVPVNPNFSDPSQIIGTLNALIQNLNGQFPNPMTPVAPAQGPAGIVSLGAFCTASGATPQTCNGQRGLVSFTGVTVAGVATGAVVINNSFVNANNNCQASIISDNSAAGSFPYIRSVVPTTGVLTVNISNAAAATSTGSSTFGISFNCVQ